MTRKNSKATETKTTDPTDSVQGSTLTQALRLLNKVADAKSQMTILGNVRIESKDDTLTLRTTDLNTHHPMVIRDGERGAAVMPMRI